MNWGEVIIVFPTHVGVYLLPGCPSTNESQFSPRTWGCTEGVPLLINQKQVFPTHVGVYRFGVGFYQIVNSFPHARGGVPANPAPQYTPE